MEQEIQQLMKRVAWLERGDDAAFLSPDEENTEETYEPQKHKNIRGREYYSQKPQSTNITSNKNNGNNK